MSFLKTWVFLGATLGLGLAACADKVATGDGAGGAGGAALGDDSGQPAANSGQPSTDGGGSTSVPACPAVPAKTFAATLGPAATVASGTLLGSALTCAMCDVGAVVIVQAGQNGAPPSYTLSLANGGEHEMLCSTPSAISQTDFSADLPLTGIQPGTYSSSQSSASSSACANIIASYELPNNLPPECEGATGPNCPAACSISSCTDGGACSPCQAGTDGVGYEANGPCTTESPFGSWQAVLTSVEPYTGTGTPAGTTAYVVHGSFTADLIAAAGGSNAGDHATMTLAF